MAGAPSGGSFWKLRADHPQQHLSLGLGGDEDAGGGSFGSRFWGDTHTSPPGCGRDEELPAHRQLPGYGTTSRFRVFELQVVSLLFLSSAGYPWRKSPLRDILPCHPLAGGPGMRFFSQPDSPVSLETRRESLQSHFFPLLALICACTSSVSMAQLLACVSLLFISACRWSAGGST